MAQVQQQLAVDVAFSATALYTDAGAGVTFVLNQPVPPFAPAADDLSDATALNQVRMELGLRDLPALHQAIKERLEEQDFTVLARHPLVFRRARPIVPDEPWFAFTLATASSLRDFAWALLACELSVDQVARRVTFLDNLGEAVGHDSVSRR